MLAGPGELLPDEVWGDEGGQDVGGVGSRVQVLDGKKPEIGDGKEEPYEVDL